MVLFIPSMIIGILKPNIFKAFFDLWLYIFTQLERERDRERDREREFKEFQAQDI